MEMRGHISHNKELVFMIKMRVHLYSYLYWGTESGSCRIFIYLFLLAQFFESWDDIWVVGKEFSRRVQLIRDRGNWFSIYGDIHVLVQRYGYRRIYRGEFFRTPHMAFWRLASTSCWVQETYSLR